MRSPKKLLAGLLAAAITAFSSVPAVYAMADADDIGENGSIDEKDLSVPELSLSSNNEFSIKAGQKVHIPVSFVKKTEGSFSYIKVTASCESGGLIVEKTEKTAESINSILNFNVEAPITAEEGVSVIVITAKIFDHNLEAAETQTFNVRMNVTTDLDASAVTIDSYKVNRSVIKPGESFELTVTLGNKSGADIKDAELELTGLDPSKFILDTGFSKQYVNIPNKMTGTVKFSLIAQNGIAYVRESLGLTLSYFIDKKTESAPRTVSTSILLTCQPSEGASAEKYGAHDLTMTNYTVSSDEVKAGTRFELTIDVKNNGGTEIKSARVSVEADGSKFSVDSGLSYCDFDIGPGASRKIKFRLIGCAGIASLRENIPIRIDFGNNSSTVSAAVSCASASGNNTLSVTGYSVSSDKISKNTMFTLSIDVMNSGGSKIENARIEVMGLDGTKFAIDSGLTYKIFSIDAGERKTISFDLIGCGGIMSVREVIPIVLEYGTEKSEISATVKCVPSDGQGTGDDGKKIFAPNIIIENYEFGGSFVTAGTQFPLTLNVMNVSSTAVIENLKVTITGGASGSDMSVAFSPANSSNTFFFEKLDSKESKAITMDMLAKADALPNSYPVEVAFTYEYSVGNERFQASGHTETITIPLRQEDRLTVNEPEIPTWNVNVGEMISLSTSLVNKGKSGVYNVTATVEGEGFGVETPTYYIGNIASGSEEYYDAKITPFNEGDVSGEIVFTYEDANGEPKEKRIPFTFTAMTMNYDNMGETDDGGYTPGMDEMPAEGENYTWVWFVVGGGILLAAAVVIIIVVVRKKKKAELEEDDDEDL